MILTQQWKCGFTPHYQMHIASYFGHFLVFYLLILFIYLFFFLGLRGQGFTLRMQLMYSRLYQQCLSHFELCDNRGTKNIFELLLDNNHFSYIWFFLLSMLFVLLSVYLYLVLSLNFCFLSLLWYSDLIEFFGVFFVHLPNSSWIVISFFSRILQTTFPAFLSFLLLFTLFFFVFFISLLSLFC